MKQYYIHNGTESTGPFTIEELKEKQVKRTTPVWYEGMNDWKHAEFIDELKDFFAATPPPLQQPPPAYNPESVYTQPYKEEPKKTNWRKIGLVLLLILIVIAVISSVNSSNSGPTYEESVMTVAEMEALNPVTYLTAGGEYKQNFWGDKLKVKGYIDNNATVTTYKDAIIRISYYSKTKSVMSTADYPVYEFLPPTSRTPFELKIDNYSNIDGIGWEVINAKVK